MGAQTVKYYTSNIFGPVILLLFLFFAAVFYSDSPYKKVMGKLNCL